MEDTTSQNITLSKEIKEAPVDMGWVIAFASWDTDTLKGYPKEFTGRSIARPNVALIPSDDPKYLEYLDKQDLLMSKNMEDPIWFEYILLVLLRKGYVKILKTLEGMPRYKEAKSKIVFNSLALAPKEVVLAFLEEYPEWSCKGVNLVTTLSMCRNLEVLDLLYERLYPYLTGIWLKEAVMNFMKEGNIKSLLHLVRFHPDTFTKVVTPAFATMISEYPNSVSEQDQLTLFSEDLLEYDETKNDDPVLNYCCDKVLLEIIRGNRTCINLKGNGLAIDTMASVVAKRNSTELILACLDMGYDYLITCMLQYMYAKFPSHLLLDLLSNVKFRSSLDKPETNKSYFADMIVARRCQGLLRGVVESVKEDTAFLVCILEEVCRHKWEKAIQFLFFEKGLSHKIGVDDAKRIFLESVLENNSMALSYLGLIFHP